MVEPSDIMEVEAEVVSCDGGDDALGHPLVWLHLDGTGQVDCPYCDRRFVRSGQAHRAA